MQPAPTDPPRSAQKGDVVTVIAGKKVPKWTIGKVFWTGSKPAFRSHVLEERVGIAVLKPQGNGQAGDKHFLKAAYVRQATPEERLAAGMGADPLRREAIEAVEWVERKLAEKQAAGDLQGLGRLIEWGEKRLADFKAQGVDVEDLVDRLHAAGAI